MLGRLIVGIVKGLIVGALVGFALVKLGLAAPPGVIAYLAAAAAGVLVGLVAGKPIWAKDAKIEAGMKAFVGALLGAALMYPARRWLTMPLPFDLHELAAPNASLDQTVATLGGTAMTSLAAIAALLGAFYEVDNDPADEAKEAPAGAKSSKGAEKKRVAEPEPEDDEEDAEDESEKKRSKK